jgi:hypothetical protein
MMGAVEVTLPALNFFMEVPQGVHVLKETFSRGVERDDLTAWVSAWNTVK